MTSHLPADAQAVARREILRRGYRPMISGVPYGGCVVVVVTDKVVTPTAECAM
jgi:hypothetical protein